MISKPTWQTLIAERVVHPDDADRFRADMDLASLRSLLFSQKSAFGVYRSEVLARTGIISFAVIPSRECSESDPWAVVMVGRNLPIESFVRLNGEEYRRDSLTGCSTATLSTMMWNSSKPPMTSR